RADVVLGACVAVVAGGAVGLVRERAGPVAVARACLVALVGRRARVRRTGAHAVRAGVVLGAGVAVATGGAVRERRVRAAGGGVARARRVALVRCGAHHLARAGAGAALAGSGQVAGVPAVARGALGHGGLARAGARDGVARARGGARIGGAGDRIGAHARP